ncbi:MAG: hypothetical protein L0H84_21770, partial [Pseudonocardia sp.]|nr:hypothetical protein [Pseudonocardia sp.]
MAAPGWTRSARGPARNGAARPRVDGGRLITGPGGHPVTAFDVAHDKRMHLIVVRRDGSGYQHVHPEPAADGTWTVAFAAPAAGSYRAFADFTPSGGPPLTLGVDLSAAG